MKKKHLLRTGLTKAEMKAVISRENNGKQSCKVHQYSGGSKQTVCLYRDATGNKCAIGCFIPDAEYKKIFEVRNVQELLEIHPHLMQFMPITDTVGLMDFQHIHDTQNKVTDGKTLHERLFRFIDECCEEQSDSMGGPDYFVP